MVCLSESDSVPVIYYLVLSVLPLEITLSRCDGCSSPPLCCVYPKPVIVVVVLKDLRWEIVVYFVDIRGIADHSLNLLFVIYLVINLTCLYFENDSSIQQLIIKIENKPTLIYDKVHVVIFFVFVFVFVFV